MVEAKPVTEGLIELNQDDAADKEFEELKAAAAKLPKRTQEELDLEMEEWAAHPLNCKELTPELLAKPEF